MNPRFKDGLRVAARTFAHHSKDWRFWFCWIGMSFVWPLLHLPTWQWLLGSFVWGFFMAYYAFPIIKDEK